ncbi:MAG: arsenate reductase family protein [Candidatus Poseidoniales archaeon]|jgi:arsenate reductase|tara:strand:- start:2608 stop:2952 length:345 start_codon:yes stop_codon:yes gene_type:complete
MGRLYHNPRCSKSRQAFQLLNESGIEFTVVEYLRQPLTFEEVRSLALRLQSGVRSLVRTGEEEFSQSGVSTQDLDDANIVAKLIIEHPILMQRPIHDNGKLAVIGRPPEDVLGL